MKNRVFAFTFLLILVLCFCVICSPGILHSESDKFIVGIVPQQSASELAKQWGPLLAKLKSITGVEFIFETAPSIPVFEQRLAEGQYDIAYMNPYHYVIFHEKSGYKALAKEKDVKIQGILVVLKESPIKDITDLNGLQIAFPAPAAFAATILPLANLKSLGINVTPSFVSSHDSVYLAVAKGHFEAGGGIARTLQNTEPAIKDALRILWETPLYTPHAFATHPRVPEAVRQAFLSGLSGLDQTSQGRELLANANFKGFTPANDEDWNDIRALGISALNVTR